MIGIRFSQDDVLSLKIDNLKMELDKEESIEK